MTQYEEEIIIDQMQNEQEDQLTDDYYYTTDNKTIFSTREEAHEVAANQMIAQFIYQNTTSLGTEFTIDHLSLLMERINAIEVTVLLKT